MIRPKTPVKLTAKTRLLTADEFQRLSDIPPEGERFKNLCNAHTRRAYKNAIKAFILFTCIKRPEEFRDVLRAHVIAWRDELGERTSADGGALSGTTIRHRMVALSSLFQYLCDKSAVTHNPVKKVKRPKVENEEDKTPALRDHQVRKLLAASDEKSLKVVGAAPSWQPCSTMLSAARNCASSGSDYKQERRGRPHPNCPATAKRRVTSRSTAWRGI